MYKECKTTQSANRQIGIAHILSEMMLTKPYEEISVSELCKKADIPRKSFYRYFDTKDDAFNFLVDKMLIECDTLLDRGKTMDLAVDKELLTQRFRYFKEHKNLIGAIANNRMSIPTIQRVCETVVSQISNFGIMVSMEDRMKIAMVTSVIFAIIMSWHHSDYETPCENLADMTYELLTKPLINPDANQYEA